MAWQYISHVILGLESDLSYIGTILYITGRFDVIGKLGCFQLLGAD